MNILISGGAGYIGSHVTNLLIDKGYNVTVIDNLITGNKELVNKKANFINCDIADENIINNLLKKNKFEIVTHPWSLPHQVALSNNQWGV